MNATARLGAAAEQMNTFGLGARIDSIEEQVG